jgi:hypothetical protein
MRYEMLDWHMRPLGKGTVRGGGVLEVPSDRPVFVVRFER